MQVVEQMLADAERSDEEAPRGGVWDIGGRRMFFMKFTHNYPSGKV